MTEPPIFRILDVIFALIVLVVGFAIFAVLTLASVRLLTAIGWL